MVGMASTPDEIERVCDLWRGVREGDEMSPSPHVRESAFGTDRGVGRRITWARRQGWSSTGRQLCPAPVASSADVDDLKACLLAAEDALLAGDHDHRHRAEQRA
jgi:hypothetical protein